MSKTRIPGLLVGWKEIAEMLGMSVSWCQRCSRRETTGERLPVFRIGGTIMANAESLRAWLLEEHGRRPGQG